MYCSNEHSVIYNTFLKQPALVDLEGVPVSCLVEISASNPVKAIRVKLFDRRSNSILWFDVYLVEAELYGCVAYTNRHGAFYKNASCGRV